MRAKFFRLRTFLLMLAIAMVGSVSVESINAAGKKPSLAKNKKQASKLRLKAIKSIQDLLKETKEKQRRFELTKRLGELYVEHYEYISELEMMLYQRNHAKWMKLSEKQKKTTTEPKPDLKRSKKILHRGVAIYEALVKKYPNAPGIDVVVYELAKMLMVERPKEAIAYFLSVPTKYPKSELIPESYLALGEYYFNEEHDMVKAKRYYGKILKYKKHEIFAYAVYKLAWTFYNYPAKDNKQVLANKRKSVKLLQKVVSVSSKKKDNRSVTLREEAIDDLIIVWADTEDIDEAWAYFNKIGSRESFYIMLEKLGKVYAEQGKLDKAVAVHTRILKEVPLRKNAPEIRAKLIDLLDEKSQVKAVVKQAKIMKQEYLVGGKWYDANQKDKKRVKEAGEKTEFTLRRYGTLYHKTGDEKNEPTYKAAAVVLYKMYIEAFPKSKERYEINYYLASLLWDLERFDAAATEFVRVAKMNTKDGKYLEDSAESAVLAMRSLVEQSKYDKLPPLGQVLKPIDLPKTKKKFVAVMDFYVSLFPKKSKALAMQLVAGRIKFSYGHYPHAIKRFKKIVKQAPESKESGDSIKIVLTYYSEKKDWVNSIASSEEFLKHKNVIHKEHILTVLKNSLYKQAYAWEKEKKYDKAALAFRKFALRFQDDPNASRALYNSVYNFRRFGNFPESFRSADILLARYPKFKHRIDIVILMAEMNESIAEYNTAAKHYENFAQSWPKDKRSPFALYNAAVLKRGLGNAAEAKKLFNRFIASYSSNALAKEAYFQIAELQEETNETKQAIATYNGFVKRYWRSDRERAYLARGRVASIEWKEKKQSKEFTRLRRDLIRDRSSTAIEARDTVARILFEQAAKPTEEFYAIKIDSFSKIEKLAGTKQQKLLGLVKSYEDVIAVKSPTYTTAALYRIGEAHADFAQDLLAVPLPADQTAENIGIIYDSIAKSAGPLKLEARKFFEAAYINSRDAELFSEWTRRSYFRASQMDPLKYGWFAEMFGQPEYYSFDLSYDQSLSEVLSH